MAYEKKKKKPSPLKVIVILAICIPFLFIMIASTLGRKEFNLPQTVSLEFVGRLQSIFSSTVGLSENVWTHYLSLVGVSRENERLNQELLEARAQNIKFKEAAATNIRLKKLLDLERSFDPPTETARIIGRDPSLWFRTLTINKGSSSGLEKGMPVVTVEGVVGRVTNTSPNYARVILAIDPNSAIDAVVQKNRVQGMIKGSGQGYLLHYVLKNHEVVAGDQIVTSGMGGIFPKGLAIGNVKSVQRDRRGMFLKIEVEPAVNFRFMEYVTVILKKDPIAD